MQINKSEQSSSWDTYWRGIGEAGAYSSGGVNHPLVQSFWEKFFQSQLHSWKCPKIIDIASGNGAVLEQALQAFEQQEYTLTSLDISAAASANISDRFPKIETLIADAASIPLDDASFDLVCSQFGVEYAGKDAVFEAARLVDDNGRLALLLHTQAGIIEQECIQSLDATRRLQASDFIPNAHAMFSGAFAAMAGASRDTYESAATTLATSITALEDIMREYGPHVAGDTIIRLYNDVDQIHQKIARVDKTEVLQWLDAMDAELDAYAGRMASMSLAAFNDAEFAALTTRLEALGFKIEQANALQTPDQKQTLAWALIAKKTITE